jgi:predicted nucleic acid-binding protein
MSAERIVYLDSSAIVKLVVREPESLALRRYLRRRRTVVSSSLARVEVSRAVLHLGARAVDRARDVLQRLDLVRLSDRVLASAEALEPAELRTLDAIHLATAGLLGETLGSVISYDDRLSEAARARGFAVHAPGRG